MTGPRRTPGQFDAGNPRCKFAETLVGELCELPGTVRFYGVLLCEKHANQLAAQERVDLLEGIVSSLTLCLRNVSIWRSANLVRLLKAERAHAESELGLAREARKRAIT